MIELNYRWIWEEESQMYTASVNDADSDKRSEDDMKYESILEKRHEMAWKESWHGMKV